MKRRSLLVAVAGICSVAGCTGSDPSAGAESDSAAEDDGSSATGSIDVVVDGEPLDHPRSEWSADDRELITVAEVIDTLPQCSYRRNGWRVLTVGESTYDERDVGTETAFFVGGSLVDPEAHELDDGDSVLVEITTDGTVSYEEDPSFIDASGEIDIVVDGDSFDLSQDRLQAENAEDHAMAFHFHEGSEKWFTEDFERVTLGEGLDLLPHVSYGREGGNHVLGIDDTEYDERTPGTELAFFVDGGLVTPAAYDLEDGDELLVEVTTGT
ncbi:MULTISPECIES: hypothetical protein [Natrialbaceae]|uniref:hypothetical protein n=1 Tax=Natrialbaceae TaxID=1644061 RepID=UPI00207D0D1D|nr:hypothetical protein [Natronococcus sp. CG52]